MVTQIDATVSERDFSTISDLVYRHCGINLHEGKRELVQARIAKKLRVGGFRSASEYLDHVLADQSGERFADMVDSLSTNLTSFFRENNHFEHLAQRFLPALLEKKRGMRDCRIRAWSAGCSSGEEPYTLAIILLEAVAGHGFWDIKVLATDISRKVLDAAQTGVYHESRLKAVPPILKSRYFLSAGDPSCLQVSPALRALVRFSYLNLQEPWPFTGPLDLILCRNVMIYFDKPTQQKLVNRFFDILEGGGLLFTGHSESLTGVNHKFRHVRPTIYEKP